jgi:CRP/FNR family transcriptional regulator, cyclic AMP receptor protein
MAPQVSRPSTIQMGRILAEHGGKKVAEKMTSKEEELRKVPLFSKLGKKNLKEIARIADVVALPAGEVLLQEGAMGFDFLMILEGQAKVEECGKVIGRLSQNDFFGEISLIARRPSPVTVTAETAVTLLVAEPGYFEDLLEQAPDLWKEIAIALCDYIPNTCHFPLDT